MGMDNSSLAMEWRYYYLTALSGRAERGCESEFEEDKKRGRGGWGAIAQSNFGRCEVMGTTVRSWPSHEGYAETVNHRDTEGKVEVNRIDDDGDHSIRGDLFRLAQSSPCHDMCYSSKGVQGYEPGDAPMATC